MKAEITWDLVMSDDMPFIEGCYRLDDGPWQVVTAAKRPEHPHVIVSNGVRWKSGVTGMNILLPAWARLNAIILIELMSNTLHVDVEDWVVVRGPDSMVLR